MKLYITPRSPFARRIRVLLQELKLPYDEVPLNVFDLPPWYSQLVNPLGRVPVLEFPTGELLVDSQMITEYFRERHSHTSLFSNDGMSEIKTRSLSALGTGMMEVVVTLFLESVRPGGAHPEVLEEWQEPLHSALKYLESELIGPYFYGATFKSWDIDIGVGLGYAKLRCVKDLETRYPKLGRYHQFLLERASFQNTQPVL